MRRMHVWISGIAEGLGAPLIGEDEKNIRGFEAGRGSSLSLDGANQQ